MLLPEEVIWGYRYLLGRDPENADVVESHREHHANWQQFRDVLLGSEEYALAQTAAGRTPGTSGLRSATLSKERAFEVAYGREPLPAEIEELQRNGLADAADDVSQLRSVITSFDRQRLATRLTVRFAEDDLEKAVCENFQLVLDRRDVSVSRNILDTGGYEPHLSSLVKRVVKPGMTAIDVGANVGFYTMLLAALVGRNGRVLAFEPNTENCRLLMLSIEANGFDHIRLFPVALSSTTGAARFTPHLGSNGGFLPNTTEAIADPNCTVVPSVRLDEIIAGLAVDFIKIDVEGAEYLALSGAEQLIRRCRPIICSEFSLEMLGRVSGVSGSYFLNWMKGFGYRIYVLRREDAVIEEVDNVDKYLSGWSSLLRIEDIAFFPQESGFDPHA